MADKKVSINKIIPNPNNPRLIKDDKFKKLVDSIKEDPEFLEAREIIVNKEHIILGGNMRYKAAKEAGITEVPVKIVDWSEEKQRRFIIKDNVSGGEWDWDILANEWDAEELEAWGLDLPTDWAEETEVEEDEAPEVSDEPPVSKLGEVYQLGRHRVMCGDSTDKASVELLMNGAKADMVFTDPPYGVAYKNNKMVAGHEYKREATFDAIENDDLDPEAFREFIYKVLSNVKDTLAEDAVLYLCTSDKPDFRQSYETASKDAGFNYSAYLIWDKGNFGFGFQNYRAKHEGILYYKVGKTEDKWLGGQDKGTIIEISKDANKEYNHPTQKPVALAAYLIKNHNLNNVLDLFLGSGSTLIACEQTDRTCYGMELDPKYVDVIRKRYAKFIQPDNQLPENWQELTPEVNND